MPIGTIVGIDSRDYIRKDTGELKNTTIIHYTHKLQNEKAVGLGAGNVLVNKERYNTPLHIGGVYLIEKGEKGFLESLEMLEEPKK